MTYNANEYVVEENESLESGIMALGVIVDITDSTVRELIPEDSHKKWKGSLDQPAIKLSVEVKYAEKIYNFNKIFTYDNNEEGKTIVKEGSNMFKFSKVNSALPTVGQKVKCKTNLEGYWEFFLG